MLRLRQIALVARDLGTVSNDIEHVLGLGPAFADPAVEKYGLINAVWPIGDTFLEVVSPGAPGTTAERLLEKRGGDGGYMAIFQVGDIKGARSHVASLGVRVIAQADRDGVHMTHLHPKDTGGAIMSLDAMDPPERWDWGGPDWRANVRTDVAVAIVGAEVQGDDPQTLGRRWAQVLDRPWDAAAAQIVLKAEALSFAPITDGRGEGLGGVTVAVRDPEPVKARAAARDCLSPDGDIVLCGTRILLVQA